MYLIRRARPRELERAQAMDRELLDGSRADYNYKSTVWWVAVHRPSGDIVGYAAGYSWQQENERAFVLSRCGVAEAHRGQGLQHRFLRARIRYARKQDARWVWTYTSAANIRSANNLIAEGFKLWQPKHWGGMRSRGSRWLHWERKV